MGDGDHRLYFNKFSRWSWLLLKFANHSFPFTPTSNQTLRPVNSKSSLLSGLSQGHILGPYHLTWMIPTAFICSPCRTWFPPKAILQITTNETSLINTNTCLFYPQTWTLVTLNSFNPYCLLARDALSCPFASVHNHSLCQDCHPFICEDTSKPMLCLTFYTLLPETCQHW